MGRRKSLGILCLFLLVMAVLSGMTLPSAIADVSSLPSEDEVRKLFDGYTARYVEKDIEGFMAFFSREAIENRMIPYADIYDLYNRTFANSQFLRYQLKLHSIQPLGPWVLVSGRYDVVQDVKTKHAMKSFSGEIQWYLTRENGVLKIIAINYGRE
jgi:hypothetical protein